ncbi:MAG TPA: DNA repair protein RecO [Thermoanaerobaculia bacterium]|nr:DNA repair protein RecO [Thermoanaerobaculia bacterium]
MRPERTEAIVLNTYPARERDKLVVFLTPEHGKKKGWAYGARSLKSRFGAALEPLAKVRLTFVEREADEVVRIESVDLIRSLFPAQQNLVANVAASYIAETVDTFAQPGDPADLIYRLLDRSTDALLAGADPISVVAYVELWILRLAGILPDVSEDIEAVMRLRVEQLGAERLPVARMRTLAAKIRREFLGHELKSYDILAGVSAPPR